MQDTGNDGEVLRNKAFPVERKRTSAGHGTLGCSGTADQRAERTYAGHTAHWFALARLTSERSRPMQDMAHWVALARLTSERKQGYAGHDTLGCSGTADQRAEAGLCRTRHSGLLWHG